MTKDILIWKGSFLYYYKYRDQVNVFIVFKGSYFFNFLELIHLINYFKK